VQGQSKSARAGAGEGQERLVLDKDVEKHWGKESGDELKLFQTYRRGDPNAKLSPDVLDHAAQWYAYRLTQSEFQEPKNNPEKGMHYLVKEALDQIVDPRVKAPTAKQSEFKEEFDKRFVARLKEVVVNPKVIARVNAAMLLARLAATGTEEAVGVLADVIQDPKENDAVRLWALRGLKDFFALGQGDNSNPFRNKDREAHCIVVLLDYLGRKLPPSPGMTSSELAALRYVRNEAVAALGETRYPAAAKTVDKKTVIERRTALALLRIMRKDGIVPEPGLKEQVTAAIALCRLRSRALEQYQPQYTAYHLGRFVVDFATLYNNGAKEPWRIQATLLSQALADFREDTQGNRDAKKYIAELVAKADSLLQEIQEGKTKPNPISFTTWLDANPPKANSVYEGVVDAVVRSADKSAE
jgi:hypothetical protein